MKKLKITYDVQKTVKGYIEVPDKEYEMIVANKPEDYLKIDDVFHREVAKIEERLAWNKVEEPYIRDTLWIEHVGSA